VIAAAWTLWHPLQATLVEECNFIKLKERAGTIFHGRCLERREVADGKPVPYTEYTFQVIEVVKGLKDAQGKAPEKITFRHAGTRTGQLRPDGLETAPLRLGVPEHEVGEEVVLFLTRESSIGLCSPVGLSQGKFKIVRKERQALVQNIFKNRGLFAATGPSSFRELAPGELEAASASQDGIELKAFLGLCKKVKE
jgi:hypothetical protein